MPIVDEWEKEELNYYQTLGSRATYNNGKIYFDAVVYFLTGDISVA